MATSYVARPGQKRVMCQISIVYRSSAVELLLNASQHTPRRVRFVKGGWECGVGHGVELRDETRYRVEECQVEETELKTLG